MRAITKETLFKITVKNTSHKHIFELFSKQHFAYILTNENHYKDFLNNGLFYKILSKTTPSTISNNKSK